MPSIVTHVQVDRGSDGHLVASWDIEGSDDCDVIVAVGDRPDRIDHSASVTVGAGTRTLTLTSPLRRAFVSVSPAGGGSAMVAAERRLHLDGVANFRDLGGYRVGDDSRIRWGRVFRSDGFHALTSRDHATFTELGLRVVYDLRSAHERAAKPNVLPDDGAIRSVELVLSAGEDDHGGLPAVEELSRGSEFLLALYRSMLLESAPVFGSLLSGLAEPDGLPAVFHCLFGKDRTGVAAAVLLTALGVTRSDVVADYELTERFQSQEVVATALSRLEGAGVPKEAAAGLLGAPGPVMAALLDEITDRHGGVDEFLTGPAGMRPDVLERLRRLLVVETG